MEWIESRFEETLKMSTYIFALCVADYPYRETNHGSVRVYSLIHAYTKYTITD